MKQNLSARKKRNGERLYHFAEVSVVGDAHVEADLVPSIRHTWVFFERGRVQWLPAPG